MALLFPLPSADCRWFWPLLICWHISLCCRDKGEGVSNLDQAWLCNWTLTLSRLSPANRWALIVLRPPPADFAPFCAVFSQRLSISNCLILPPHTHTHTHIHNTHKHTKTEKHLLGLVPFVILLFLSFLFFVVSYVCLVVHKDHAKRWLIKTKLDHGVLSRTVQQTNRLCTFSLSPPMSYVDSISCRKHNTLCFCRCWCCCWNKTKYRTKRRVD